MSAAVLDSPFSLTSTRAPHLLRFIRSHFWFLFGTPIGGCREGAGIHNFEGHIENQINQTRTGRVRHAPRSLMGRLAMRPQ